MDTSTAIAKALDHESLWWDDPDEVLAFARWYFDGYSSPRIKGEIFDVFEKPWHWDEDYQTYKEGGH
jgi:hypothetical protein